MVNAVIFVPATDAQRWIDICAEYCERHHYTVISVATTWDDVVTLLQADEAQVAVVARRDQLPAQRKSRLEVVAEVLTTATGPTRRRPKRKDSAAAR